MPHSIEWIFFDCFNTLIDDFDEDGDESGLGPMQHLPVEAGLYSTVYELRRDYLDWREQNLTSQAREIPIQDRLTALLKRRAPDYPRDQRAALVAQMVDCFLESYESDLRLPAGVLDMLTYWQGKVSMGVVSNFHVSALPERLLEKFGLRSYLKFVVDSAECGYRKPSTEIYSIAAHAANLRIEDYSKVLFIGDHLLNDVLTPQSLGMSAIHFDRSLERPRSAPTPKNIPSIRGWANFRSLPPVSL
ncbi:MAG: HAD family hydrolase [Cyanobacteria bacterium P01_F01_bin.42]